MSSPSQEMLLANYAAAAATAAVNALAVLGYVDAPQVEKLIAVLEDCRMGTADSAPIDRHIDSLIDVLARAPKR